MGNERTGPLPGAGHSWLHGDPTKTHNPAVLADEVARGLRCSATRPARALTFPPPGWCFRFSVEPILDLTFFRSGMGTGAVCRRLLAEDGDLGGVRTTATFLGSRAGGVGRDGVRERLPGVPGEPGLL